MAKFKIGDIIIGNDENPYSITAKDVKCKVIKVYDERCIKVKALDIDDYYMYEVNPEYFDLVNNDEITITRHGNKVVAKYGKKVGVAKCSPEDEFDFAIGAKLAFERLMGFVEPTLKHTDAEIKVGDNVRIIGGFGFHNFPIGSVVKVKDIKSTGGLCCIGKNKRGDTITQHVHHYNVEKVANNAFDWDGFKTSKFFVKCTKDNFNSFTAEAKKHGCKFVPDENFNPFATGAMHTAKLFFELSGLKTVDKNEVLVVVINGNLLVDVTIPSDRKIVTW